MTAAVALVLLAAAIEHYREWSEAWWARLLLAAGALFLIAPELWAEAVGVALVTLAIGLTRLRAWQAA